MLPSESPQNRRPAFEGRRFSFIRFLAASTTSRGIPESGTGTAEEYKDVYRTELEETGVEQVPSELTRLYQEGGEKPLVLLC